MKRLATLSAVAVLASFPAVSATNWKDRQEYDLVLKIRAEAVPQKRLALLDEWKTKFPQSELRQVRRELYLTAYQSMGDAAKMLATAEEMVGEQQDNFVGLYWCTLLIPSSTNPSPDRLKIGDIAARQLLKSLDGFFTPAKRPASINEADWRKERDAVERLARRTLGWVQWQMGDYAAAEKEFTDYLKTNPKDAEISSWAGTVMALQRKPEKISPALWHLAHAAGMRDAGALPESQRRQADSLLERLYSGYHGEDSAGLDKLRADASSGAFPPENFAVESAAAMAARKADEELERTNPELFAWMKMRRRLEQADGETYFEQSVKNVPTPKLKATLLKSSPAGRPKELVVWVGEQNAEEVTIKLDAALPNDAEPGTPLAFEGVPASFTKTPFNITIAVERDKIEGWPPRRR